MSKNIGKACIVCILFFVLFTPYYAYSQGWPGTKIKSLPDSSFAVVEVKKDGTKVRHFPCRDINGRIDIDQLIYCLGTFSDETWLRPEKIEIARKGLEEHYYRFKLNQTKEGIKAPININTASLRDLVRLPNIGPVTAVKIYRFRETHGLFKNVEDIKNVEGIGPAIFAGIRYYIKVR
ncbi:MAG: ComEA family DNA-binding protein [Desulfobacteraceae bacterium]|nr:MAG: ComEA family DNA-binding protein [Desulfobacteraceae bacterium]